MDAAARKLYTYSQPRHPGQRTSRSRGGENALSSPEESDRATLRLKDGQEVAARPALVYWKRLQSIQRVYPLRFRDLCHLAQNQPVAPEAVVELRTQYVNFFDADGRLHDMARTVIGNSLRQTPDGPTLVNPFALVTANEAQLFDQLDRADDVLLRRLLNLADEPRRDTP